MSFTSLATGPPEPFRFVNKNIDYAVINYYRAQGVSGCNAGIICSNGQLVLAHKGILVGCSDYFEDLVKANSLDTTPETHSIIFVLVDINFTHMNYIIKFLYDGETYVPSEIISDFMDTVYRLQIKGLMPYKDEASALCV